jgi:hypothetical protein
MRNFTSDRSFGRNELVLVLGVAEESSPSATVPSLKSAHIDMPRRRYPSQTVEGVALQRQPLDF